MGCGRIRRSKEGYLLAVRLVLLTLLFSGLAFAKPIAEFLGKEGIKCTIIRSDNKKERCDERKRFKLEVGDVVKANAVLTFRLLSDDAKVSDYREGGLYVYVVSFKENPGIVNSLKVFFDFFSDYKREKNIAATRGLEDGVFGYPRFSFVAFDELVRVKLKKNTFITEPVVLEFYKEDGKRLPDLLVLEDKGGYYYAEFTPEEIGLEKLKSYEWKLRDKYGVIAEGALFVTNASSQELEGMVNELLKSVKYGVNDELKKALIYAKLGYLWRAYEIFSKYEKEGLDKAYLREIEKYFKEVE